MVPAQRVTRRLWWAGLVVVVIMLVSGRSATWATEVPFAAQPAISWSANGAISVFAADVDGDGDTDALSASAEDDKIAWYENTDGTGTFGVQRVVSTLADAATSVFAADVDGDGDTDILSGSLSDHKIAWYENMDGAGTFGAQQVISSLDLTPYSVFARDVDGDGDTDVLSASILGNNIAWFENTDGAGTFSAQQVISSVADSALSVFAADVDGDGDTDALSASYNDDKIAWYENLDGSGTFGAQQVISTLAAGAHSVHAADVDGDGDTDVLSASALDSKIAWYENTDGAGTFGAQRVISTLADTARSVFAADVDGDGDTDVLSASNGSTIAWYENTDGAGTFGAQQAISIVALDARAVFAADVDGDGDADVLSASYGDDKIAWYENETVLSSSGAVPDGHLVPGAPLTVGKTGPTEISLSWDPSCSAEDFDFEVYQGTLGNFTSHMPSLCSTNGSTSVTLDDPEGFAWAGQLGGSSYESATSVATDANGNVYTAGVFVGTVDFDPGIASYELTSTGQGDIFVSKLDRDGRFIWARSMGGPGGSNSATSVAVDASGNVYAVGYFYATVDFDPGPGVFNLTTNNNSTFISKLDRDGDFVWATSMGGAYCTCPSGVAVDASGNVYTAGTFTGTSDFDPGPGTYHLTALANDAFVSKLGSGGNFIWARQLGGSNYDYAWDVAVDAGGSAYTLGIFASTADFDPGPGTFNLTSAGNDDVFVSKLDSAGNFVWAKRLGGASGDYPSAVAVDAGETYIVGRFRDTADFDPGPGTFNLTSAGSYDAFISKLDAAGQFVWARRLGGSNFDRATDVAVDAGRVYTVGYFFDTADFDPGPGSYNLLSAGGSDAFRSTLDVAGNFVSAEQLGGTDPCPPFSCEPNYGDSTDAASGVAANAGSSYTVGSFQGTVDFDPGPGSFELLSVGNQDAFILKFAAAGNRYYLVVPTNAVVEGSYGTNSSGLERPRSVSSCLPQLVGNCP